MNGEVHTGENDCDNQNHFDDLIEVDQIFRCFSFSQSLFEIFDESIKGDTTTLS